MGNGENINVKVTPQMRDMIDEIVETDTHFTISEVIRDSVRVYIKNNYPDVWEKHRNGGERDDK